MAYARGSWTAAPSRVTRKATTGLPAPLEDPAQRDEAGHQQQVRADAAQEQHAVAGDRVPGSEGPHDPGGERAEQDGRHQAHRPGDDHRLPPDRAPLVPAGAPGVRGVDRGGLPHRVEGHGRDVQDLVGEGVRGHGRHPEPGHDRDQDQRPALAHGEVGGHGRPGPQGAAQRGAGGLGGADDRGLAQRRVAAHGAQAGGEGHTAAQDRTGGGGRRPVPAGDAAGGAGDGRGGAGWLAEAIARLDTATG